MLVKWPLFSGIFTQHRLVLQPEYVPRALWTSLEKRMTYPSTHDPSMCTLPLTYFTSFHFCCVWLSSNRRQSHNEREKSTVSHQTAKGFPHLYTEEMKVSLLLSLPGPALIWTMWKHHCEGRVVSCDARVCIWKFHMILKTHLILWWDHWGFYLELTKTVLI